MTKAQIQALINSYIATGGNILATELKSILDAMLNPSGGHVPINGQVITYDNIILSSLKTGDVINDYTLLEGDIIACLGQTTESEKGIYTVGLNAGDTDRHEDYPDAAACANKIFVSDNPDIYSCRVLLLTLVDGIVSYDLLMIPKTKDDYVVGVYTENIPDNAILEKIRVCSTGSAPSSLKIGTTVGGDDILAATTLDGAAGEVIQIDYAGGNKLNSWDVYFEVLSGRATIIFYKDINIF